jgi:hypothetical protein
MILKGNCWNDTDKETVGMILKENCWNDTDRETVGMILTGRLLEGY